MKVISESNKLRSAPVNTSFCILLGCTVHCPCGTSLYTFWATHLPKATSSSHLLRKHKKKTQHASKAVPGIPPHGKSPPKSPHGQPGAILLGIQMTAQVQGNENHRVSAESHWLRSLMSQTETSTSNNYPSHSFQGPHEVHTHLWKVPQGSSKLLLLTKNWEFMHSSSQSKYIYQIKIIFTISSVA